jgi:multidrug efflux system membrane fusion protein
MNRDHIVGQSVATALAALLLAGCHRPPAAPPPPVTVIALPLQHATQPAGAQMRFPVEVGSRYSTAMSFRVSGKIIERGARLGDRVKRGQVLARIDQTDIEKQLAGAQATLDAAEHRMGYAQHQLERDQAQMDRNLIAINQFEQTQDAFSGAHAERDQAAAQLAIARNSLSYTSLVADRDGVITSENADTGQVVTAGQQVYGLAWNGDSDVLLDAAEGSLGQFAVGQTAQIVFSALPGRQLLARVREIGPAADPQSRTYRIKLTLTPPDAAVRLGMTGEATLSAAAADSDNGADQPFSVPATALFHKDSRPAVWIVDPQSVLQLREVAVSRYADNAVWVTQGLREGDVVLLAGVHTVYAGEHVKAVRPLYDERGEITPAAAEEKR